MCKRERESSSRERECSNLLRGSSFYNFLRERGGGGRRRRKEARSCCCVYVHACVTCFVAGVSASGRFRPTLCGEGVVASGSLLFCAACLTACTKKEWGEGHLSVCVSSVFFFFFPHSRDKLFCLLQAARPAPLVHVSRTGASFPLWVPSPTNCQKPGLRKSYTPVHKKIVYAAEFSFCLYKFLGNEIWQCLRLF